MVVWDENIYEKGKKITDEELEKINLSRHEFQVNEIIQLTTTYSNP